MKYLLLFSAFLLSTVVYAQRNEYTWERIMRNHTANRLAGFNGSGAPVLIDPSTIGAVTSVFGRTGIVVAQNNDYTFAQIGSKPTTLSGYGITDPVVFTSGSYANPSWITSLAYAKLTGAPTVITNSGAANEVVKSDGTNIVGTGLFTSVNGFWTRTGNFNLTTTGDVSFNTDNGTGLHANHVGTNSVYRTLLVSRTTPDVPAVGIGVSMEFEVETASGNNERGAAIEAVTTSVTPTAENFDMVFKTMAGGTAASEKLRITSAGDIGIGVSPTYQLHLKSRTDVENNLRIENANGDNLFSITSDAAIGPMYMTIGDTPVLLQLVIKGLPTVNPCGSSPSGTVWNDAGTLKICP